MPRQIWLADELRKVGLAVIEVPGWKTRGSETFNPIGVTWHATAGSSKATAQSEVNVILHGSETAPPPIAQFMIFRDGVVYVCAAGRCNHNKVGWDGPNEGLGNTQLFGIEMSNNNKGQPWPAVQLDAARRVTAVLFEHMKTNPMQRLAAHYEHQPWATMPEGEKSSKSDPFGVIMTNERPRVAAILKGDTVTKAEFLSLLKDMEIRKALCTAVWVTDGVITAPPGSKNADGTPNTHWSGGTYIKATYLHVATQVPAIAKSLAELATKDFINEDALAHALIPLLPSGQLAQILREGMTAEQIARLVQDLQDNSIDNSADS